MRRALVRLGLWLSLSALWGGAIVWAAPMGAVVKVTRGTAWIQRAGQLQPSRVGLAVREGDVLMTGADGVLGVTFSDNSLMSIGPSSKLGIIAYAYDPVTQRGRLETTLYWGTLSATSGRVAREAVDTMSITTPRSVYRIHGTDIVLRIEGAGP